MNKQDIIIGVIAGVLLLGLVGGSAWLFQNSSSSTVAEAVQSAEITELSEGFVASSTAELNDNADGIEWDELSSYEVTLSDETLTITEPGTYVLTGESTASVVVNSEGDVRLALNGVHIVSSDSAAISVENADNTVIYLVDGSENYLEDASIRSNQEIDGALFSADDLMFVGNGKLSVDANYEDGIVSNDDLTIYSGEIAVESVDEGIRGRDSVVIAGGVISVDAEDDGIRASNDTDLEKGYLHILGGSITVNAGDDAIKAVTSIVVDGGIIVVTDSLEGMEATNITINDGAIAINAYDDAINAVPDGLSTDAFIVFNGGTIDVTVTGNDSDGIDSNGYVTIAGGTIYITCPPYEPVSPFDYDTTVSFTGGTVIINSEEVSEIPEPFGVPGGGAPTSDGVVSPGRPR